MSIFAGIFRIDSDTYIEQSLCNDIVGIVNRNPLNKTYIYKNKGIFLCHVDIGAFPDAGIKVNDKGVMFLAGDPLLSGREESSRSEELSAIKSNADLDDWSLLQDVRGTFCLCYYNLQKKRLTLVADKIGVRPLYYWSNGKTVVFSTIFRVFKNILKKSLQLDLEGLVQEIAFGYQIGERTSFENVLRLDGSMRVEIDSTSVVSNRYWTLTGRHHSSIREADCEELHKTFLRAVDIRLRGATNAHSFLSGGLDSRCVVGALSQLGISVDTFNFSRSNTLDQLLATDFAKAIGSTHFEQTIGEDHRGCDIPSYYNSMQESNTRFRSQGERCGSVWSGDGGSVGMGHEYLTQAMIDFLKNGQIEHAVHKYLERSKILIPARFLKKDIFRLFKNLPYASTLSEIDKIDLLDRERLLYIFLIKNDQKRHLDLYYEEIDNHRIELILPFFDSEFMTLVISMPIDDFLYHKLYNKWLSYFPPQVKNVPWQAYCGHVPCPLPVPVNARGQWDKDDRQKNSAQLEKGLLLAEKILHSGSFPDHLLSKRNLLLAKTLMKLGLRDYSYLFKSSAIVCKYYDEKFSREMDLFL